MFVPDPDTAGREFGRRQTSFAQAVAGGSIMNYLTAFRAGRLLRVGTKAFTAILTHKSK